MTKNNLITLTPNKLTIDYGKKEFAISLDKFLLIEKDGSKSKFDLGEFKSLSIKELSELEVIYDKGVYDVSSIQENTIVITTNNRGPFCPVSVYLKASDLDLSQVNRTLHYTIKNGWEIRASYRTDDGNVQGEFISELKFSDNRNSELKSLAREFYNILDNEVKIYDDEELDRQHIDNLRTIKREYMKLFNILSSVIKKDDDYPKFDYWVGCNCKKKKKGYLDYDKNNRFN